MMQPFSKRRPPNFSNPPDFSSALNFAANSFAPGTPWINSPSPDDSYKSWSPNYTNFAQQEIPYSAFPWSSNATMNPFRPRSSSLFDDILNRFQKYTLNHNQVTTPPYSADVSRFSNTRFDYSANVVSPQKALYRPPRMRRRVPSCVECVFCKNNGATEAEYRGHILKDPEGNIQCPVLRAYNCPVCNNGGGAKAHTIRYCPLNRPQGWRNNLDSLVMESRTKG
ncbi:Nanos like protein 1-like protein [Leptotrombidium deliense]|uniref:Nanos like protein 1-like protein n=1 Tax=Leptotrombidium deliense TaxID=299467 RepID=A0A443SFC6_9ACAR|nr:Nanos like protein 1-like protein [Leptotrombidium deliense]